MSSPIDDAGCYVPFVDGMPDCEDWELQVLKRVKIHVWPYGGNDDDEPERCTVQLCAFYNGDAVADQGEYLMVDLIDVIRKTFDSNWCGPKAEAVALRKLVAGINEIIARMDVKDADYAKILTKATRVFGSQDEAEQWLRRPAIELDQKRPVDLLTTLAGVQLVEDYLGRLEYNVYT